MFHLPRLPGLALGFFLLSLPVPCLPQPASDPPKPTPEVQALLDKAEKVMDASDKAVAFQLYEQALERARVLHDRTGEAFALHHIGQIYSDLSQPQKALSYFEQTLSIARELKDKNVEGSTLDNIGLVYFNMGQPPKALTYYEQALALKREIRDESSQARTLTNIGFVYSDLNQPQKALGYYEQALSIFRKANNRRGEGVVLNSLGSICIDMRDSQKALKYFGTALPINREVRNKSEEAFTLHHLGLIYSGSGQTQKALLHLEQALSLRRAIGDKSLIAITLDTVGHIYFHLGHNEKALTYYEQVLPLARASKNKSQEAITLDAIGWIYSDLDQPQKALAYYEQALSLSRELKIKEEEAFTLHHLGLIYSDLGQPQKALTYYEQALSLRRAMGDKSLIAITLDAVGHVYSHLGQAEKALAYYEQALALQRASGNRSRQAGILTNIGEIYSDLGQSPKALTYYEQALPLSQESKNKDQEAFALHHIGLTYSNLGQAEKALAYLEQALTLRRAIGNKGGEAFTLNEMGRVYSDLRQPQKALTYYEQALALFQQTGYKRGVEYTFANIGSLKENQGFLSQAEAAYKQAISAVETYRENIGSLSEARQSFLEERLSVYHIYLHLLLKQRKLAQAFALAQQTKARVLLDTLAGGKVNLLGKLTPEEQAKEQHLLAATTRLHSAMIMEATRNQEGSKGRFAALSQGLAQAEAALQTYRNTLYSLHPLLQRHRIAQTATLADVRRFLPADTALLEYVTLGARNGKNKLDETILLVVTIEQGQPVVQFYPIAKTTEELQEKVEDFRAACSDASRAYREKARDLANLLLPPATLKQIGRRTRLLVCPDGPLWGVPYAALRLPDDQFALQRFEIAYAYSATGAEAALHARQAPQRPKPTRTLLAFANPDFGDANRFGDAPPANLLRPITAPSRPLTASSRPITVPSRSPGTLFKQILTERGGISPLPGTQQEAEALQVDFPGMPPNVRIVTGKDAQKTLALKEMRQYRFLHFATHGWLNDTVPLLSSIVLAQPSPQERATGEEGLLTARELFDQTLSAEMVVLSACNTAQGRTQSGEGMVGLTWALFVAGSPTQVVSQWSVNDESTAALMKTFYANLVQVKMPKGDALRQASLKLSQSPEYSHPYYWAPFILMGDWH